MLTALHSDDEILVIDKPAGLATQPGAGVRISLVEAVERDFGFRPFLVHRLDKETAGCIIVARDSRMAAKWTELVASRGVRKLYRAAVAGLPGTARGTMTMPVKVRGQEREAETKWRLLGAFGGRPDPAAGAAAGGGGRPRFAWLELELGTGRTHQIRLQLAAAGLPILGDEAHGNFALNKELRKGQALKRLLLQAWRLELPGGIRVEAPLPDHFRTFFAGFSDGPEAG
jgi:23S rRNA pseudouridine955/2504/2580 synthase